MRRETFNAKKDSSLLNLQSYNNNNYWPVKKRSNVQFVLIN